MMEIPAFMIALIGINTGIIILQLENVRDRLKRIESREGTINDDK